MSGTTGTLLFSLLRNKNFLLLWLGQICSQFGDRLTQLILIALVAQRAPGSALTLAKVLVATSLPALLVNPIAGVYVDRWDRKRTMIVCDFLRAAALLSLPWLAKLSASVPLYMAVFFIFGVATFFVPARLALIPHLVPPDRLAQANSLLTSSGMIGSTITLLIGALMVEWMGAKASVFVNAISYIASAFFILCVASAGRERLKKSPSLALVFEEIWEGTKELWKHPHTRRAAILLGILMAGSGASVVTATVLIQKTFGTVTKDLGFLSLWLGLGMLAGSVAFGRWGTSVPRRKILGLSFIGFGSALWIFVMSVLHFQSTVLAAVSAGLLGVWIAPVGIVTNTLVHEGHPQHLHGRIFSGLGVVVNLSLILSMLVAGRLVEEGGRGLLLVSVGGFFAAGGFFLLCYTKSRR